MIGRLRSQLPRVVQNIREGGLAAESVWGMAVEVVTLASTMTTFVLLGRSLGPSGYGSYLALYALCGPLSTFSSAGVTLTLMQHIVRFKESVAATAQSCFSMSVVGGSLLVVVTFALSHWIVDDLTTLARLSILLTEFVAMPLVLIGATTIQSTASYIGAAKISIVVSLTKLAVVAALHVAGALTVASLSLTLLCTTLVLAVVVLRQLGKDRGFTFRPGRVPWRHVKTNLAFSVGISGAALNNDGDKTVLAANGLNRDNGLYGAAGRVVSMGMIPVASLINVTHKRFLEHEEGVKGQHVRRALRFTLPAAGYATVWCVAIIALGPLLPLVLGEDFRDSVGMIVWIAPVMIIRTFSMFPHNALMGMGNIPLRSAVILVNAFAALGIYIALIPRWGWRGAAGGTLISETIELILVWGTLIVLQRRDDRAIDERMAAGESVGV